MVTNGLDFHPLSTGIPKAVVEILVSHHMIFKEIEVFLREDGNAYLTLSV